MAESLTSCPHYRTKRGADAPRRWGSHQTEVCVECGEFRLRTHLGALVTGWNGGWRLASEYAEATAEMELD